MNNDKVHEMARRIAEDLNRLVARLDEARPDPRPQRGVNACIRCGAPMATPRLIVGDMVCHECDWKEYVANHVADRDLGAAVGAAIRRFMDG